MITEKDLNIGRTYYRANKHNKFGIEFLILLEKVKGRRAYKFQMGRRKVIVRVRDFYTLFLNQAEAQMDFVQRLREYCDYYERVGIDPKWIANFGV